MNARTLLALFDSIYVLALTSLVGSILFFSFAVAPIIFGTLGAESGAKFVRALFPRYYAWGATSCAIALPALICGTLSYPELRGPWVGVQAGMLLGTLLLMLYCGNSLTPAINNARDAGPAQASKFDGLHKRSVMLNSVALLVGLVLLVAFAVRRPVQTSGIEEPTPQQRALAEAEARQKYEAARKKAREAAPSSP